jgi:hypothetical protein
MYRRLVRVIIIVDEILLQINGDDFDCSVLHMKSPIPTKNDVSSLFIYHVKGLILVCYYHQFFIQSKRRFGRKLIFTDG